MRVFAPLGGSQNKSGGILPNSPAAVVLPSEKATFLSLTVETCYWPAPVFELAVAVAAFFGTLK